MLICHCRAITDAAIEAHLEAGVRGEADLVQRCGAGRRCGGCLPVIRELLNQWGIQCPLRQPSSPSFPHCPAADRFDGVARDG